MNASVWYHPWSDLLGHFEGGLFSHGAYVTILVDRESLKRFGWVYIGEF